MKGELEAMTRLMAEELSIVDAGANKKKRFPVTKSKTEEKMDADFKAVLETEANGETELLKSIEKAKLSKKGTAATKGALRILSAYKDELPEEALNALSAAAGLVATEKEAEYDVEGVQKFLGTLTPEQRAELVVEKKKEDPKEGANQMPEVSDELKAVMKAQEDRMEALTKQNEDVTKALNKVNDEREGSVFRRARAYA